ncbi:AGC/PKA protein kinase [Puccinia graminis f. sp. tritici CRL 75-36-700-3]|uniref:cAMP-dependent protein kinase n=1 Tax=Puccinia graminis f. sp. tritici (strain CRL 75-36-700-3 / race SCCL) TaxID=418459 RepID=E3L414_PUCGT|nr:AGC/PKA protein kinase [Puccinia graminis f. sp. tritici CRL 75-36-700-3]EFP91289.1 AGC/PKA protein kinase [Puccinia graminis f. sp. tritici CRL 75-36-700-3]
MSTFDPMTVNQADLTFNHPPPPKYAPPASTDLPNLVSPMIQPPTPLGPSTPLSHSTTPSSANHQLHPQQQQQQQSHLLQQQQLQQYQQHQHQQHELLKQQQQQLKQQQQQLKQQQHELLLQQQQQPTNPHFPASSPIPVSTPLESNPSSSQASDPTKTPRKTSSRYALADFDLIRTLGTGSFGRVHLSKSRHNGRGYAIKVLNKKRVVGLKQVEHTNSERQMLAAVRHPFLVNLWGTFADSYNLYMVMDFVSGGELFNLLRKSQRFPDPVAKFFGAEVALALDYLHCLDIVYRDLKPENILLGSDGHIKITDFGFAKLVPDITWTLCGTPDYLAPEIVQSKGYNKSVDWYALGVLIFEMLAGYPPFYCEEESPMRLYEKIIAGKVRYPSYFNPSAKDLLKSLLTADLSKRFGNLANGSRDIFHHGWFAEVDWERLYRKQIPAPYVPRVSSEWDASNFDHYDEASLEEYGKVGEDPYGHLFPGF